MSVSDTRRSLSLKIINGILYTVPLPLDEVASNQEPSAVKAIMTVNSNQGTGSLGVTRIFHLVGNLIF